MTAYDRLLCAMVRLLMRRIERRLNQGKGRVFWMKIATMRPQRLLNGTYTPKSSILFFGVGGSEAEAHERRPGHPAPGTLATVHLTREMTELMYDGLTEGLRLQDAQYAIVEQEQERR